MKENIERTRKVLENYRTQLLMELNSLDSFMECSIETYDYIIDFAIKKDFERVVDIGCAFGHQAELCNGRIRYIGINEDEVNFYQDNPETHRKNRKIKYEVGKYPYPCNNFKNDLAISNLAIGWQCYVNEEECKKQFEALSKDFKASLLYLPMERAKFLNKYFKNIEVLIENKGKYVSSGLYYCYN